MSKIGDVFRGIGNRIDKKEIKKTSSEQTIVEQGEQFTKSEESLPDKVSNVITQMKEEVLDPLKEFINEHPNLETIIPAMFAGGIAGICAKKSEEKKEIALYMKNMQKFMNKIERIDLFAKAAKSAAPWMFAPLALIGLEPALSKDAIIGLIFASEVGILGGIVSACAVSDKKIASKDGKFLKTGPHKFAAVSPSGDKLIFCDIIKDVNGRKPIPKKTIILDSKATHLSCDQAKEKFYVHQDGKSTLFSLDGKELGNYNTIIK